MNQILYNPLRLRILGLLIALAMNGCSSGGNLKDTLEEFHTRQGNFWAVQLSDDQQTVTSLVGRGNVQYGGESSENATQFLRENHRLFGLTQLDDVRLINNKVSDFGSHVEFQQILKGLPVENGRVQINFDKEGRVINVVSSIAPTAGALEQTSVTPAQATEIAIFEFLRTTPHNPSKDEQQDNAQRKAPAITRDQLELNAKSKVEDVFFANKSLRRAYKILISATIPFGIKEFVTDANNGEILQTRDFVFNATDGQGKVFKPNPVNSLNNSTLTDNDDDDNAVAQTNPNPYYTETLRALEGTGPFTLRGPYVVLENIEPPANALASQTYANGFNYLRNADAFEDVMVYYHIDRIQQYIRSLGILNAMNWPIRVDAHGLSGADNSRYVRNDATPRQSYLAFGDGGVDDAEDADVIAHEYGHALQDDQAPRKYSTTGFPKAMGEGFGDYWAVSIYAAETAASNLPCVMEWDAVPRCRRRVDKTLTAYNYNPGLSAHINGEIWSATLFDIFSYIDKTTADKLILQSHFLVPDSPTFKQGANAIVAADVAVFSGSHVPLLCAIFKSRRIYGANDCPVAPYR